MKAPYFPKMAKTSQAHHQNGVEQLSSLCFVDFACDPFVLQAQDGCSTANIASNDLKRPFQEPFDKICPLWMTIQSIHFWSKNRTCNMNICWACLYFWRIEGLWFYAESTQTWSRSRASKLGSIAPSAPERPGLFLVLRHLLSLSMGSKQ